ncbi:glycosyl hydrolase family 18 protein [Niameybacter massiliensis]|uniref:chitinase n=1 Tax=Holtiella tumoricola TaxID=3018743 RepID=A0AA42J0B2_9FIRM|nr:glycosyl hydrolase family 18 protein [Holtiella tumoricola]MDA3730848.1 glycosyl hydrolase family 18 protein [Holtiella tumoricola]
MRLKSRMLIGGITLLSLGIVGCTGTMLAREATEQEVAVTKSDEAVEEIIPEVQEAGITLLELEGGMQEINLVELSEVGSNVRKFHLEAKIDDEWQTIYNNDLIEAHHLCVLPEDVTTDAIRLVVEEEVAPTQIASISARYLEGIEREQPFTNTAYVSSTYFEHDWDVIHPKNFDSLTDIIMIGNFSFNNRGEFIVIEHEPDGTGGTPHLFDSEYAKTKFPEWQGKVTRDLDDDANVWVSITCFKGEPDGSPNGATDVFNNQEVRKAFLDQLVAFAKEYNIAGYDIDWEYPATASQWKDYNNLILEASALFKENGLMISSAQSTGTGLSLESLNALDRINIMSYDNYATTNNHSTFYNSAVKIIKEFKNKGIEPHKLILGLPYYGVKVDSYFEQWDYKHIYNQMMEANEYDPGVNLHGGWGFNGANLIRDKVVYAIEQEIGGVFCWQMKNDIETFGDGASLATTTSETIDRFIED